MEQNWVMYPLETEEGMSLVGINVALSSIAPDPARPACTLIYIPFKEPGDDGMGDAKERDRISTMEDALTEKLDASIGAIHVASVRGDGVVAYWMYSRPKAEPLIERAAREAFPGYDVDCQTNPDAKWEAYWDLLPDNDTMREIADLHLVHLLESKGDDLVTPRPVDHFAVFPAMREAERFMKMAGKHEFESRVGESADDGPITIIATREDPVDFESIHEVSSLVSNLAQAEEGEYDGWETRVIEKK